VRLSGPLLVSAAACSPLAPREVPLSTNYLSTLDSHQLATKQRRRGGKSSSTVEARRQCARALMASVRGGPGREDSSVHALADGAPIWASITEFSGSALLFGGGNCATPIGSRSGSPSATPADDARRISFGRSGSRLI
jgi:hypothetical protein